MSKAALVVRAGALLLACHASVIAQTTFRLESTAFKQNQSLPIAYTGYGEAKSPPLSWSGVPKGTKELALVVDDPDVPMERLSVHWLLYNIPASVSRIPETPRPPAPGLARPSPLKDATQGLHALKRVGYLPPRPMTDSGLHHYTFTLYALDADLPIAKGVTKDQLLAAIKGHVLAEAKLVAVFEPKE